MFFGIRSDFGAGGEPEFSRAGVAAKALAGLHVDDSGDVIGRAGGDFGAQCSGPADGKNQIDGTAIFNGGKGAGRGGLTGAGACGDPFLFFVALCPEVDAVAGGVRPAGDERLELAGHGGDDGCAGHWPACDALAGA
jgi:hypothetical protein